MGQTIQTCTKFVRKCCGCVNEEELWEILGEEEVAF